MPERKGKPKKEITLVLDGNPYARTKRDRKMLLELFDFVDGHRNSFFLLLGKPEYEKLAGWADSKLARMISRAGFIPTWGTKCVWLFRGMTGFPICPVCGKPFGDKANVSLAKGYNHHCSNRCKTLDPDVQSKMSATCMREYGVDWSSKSTESRQKSKETCQTKYGVDNVFQADWVKDKSRRTNKTRHGDENYRNHKQRTETCKRIYGKGNNGDVISRTLLSFSDDEKAEWTKNIKAAKLENHGDENYNNPEQTKKTCMEKFGVPYAPQAEIVKQHKRETFIKHFGCDHNWKDPEVRKRIIKNKKFYKYDGLSFDSKAELCFYIGCKDGGITIEREPEVLQYSYGGETHLCFYDFRLNGTVKVEIKGDHFFRDKDRTKDMICPWKPRKNSGYTQEFLNAWMETKHQCMLSHGVVFVTSDEYKKYIKYVEDKYGKSFLKQFVKPRCRKKPL